MQIPPHPSKPGLKPTLRPRWTDLDTVTARRCREWANSAGARSNFMTTLWEVRADDL
jgi:hypothetical protein